jgi:hypothetical protein
MEPEHSPLEQEVSPEPKSSVWNTVTPLSKYLAMALFIALPFVAGYIGYTLAPEKIIEVPVEVERIVVEEKMVENTVLESDRRRRIFFKADIPENWKVYSVPAGEVEASVGEVNYLPMSEAFPVDHRTLRIQEGVMDGQGILIDKENKPAEEIISERTNEQQVKYTVDEVVLNDQEVVKITSETKYPCRGVLYVYSFLEDLSVTVRSGYCVSDNGEVYQDTTALAESLEFHIK